MKINLRNIYHIISLTVEKLYAKDKEKGCLFSILSMRSNDRKIPFCNKGCFSSKKVCCHYIIESFDSIDYYLKMNTQVRCGNFALRHKHLRKQLSTKKHRFSYLFHYFHYFAIGRLDSAMNSLVMSVQIHGFTTKKQTRIDRFGGNSARIFIHSNLTV